MYSLLLLLDFYLGLSLILLLLFFLSFCCVWTDLNKRGCGDFWREYGCCAPSCCIGDGVARCMWRCGVGQGDMSGISMLAAVFCSVVTLPFTLPCGVVGWLVWCLWRQK
jgi:hypothetical protein